MRCLNCKEKIIIKRNILNLFSLKKEYICKSCFNLSLFNPQSLPFPIQNYNLAIQYLIENQETFIYDSLNKENTAIYNVIKKYDFFIIHLNRFYFKESSFNFLEHLANHLQRNILIYVYVIYD